MSIITDFLNLFKYDPETDGDNTFNIKQCLNDNWDKIDAWASGIKTTITGLVPGTRKVNGKELSADVTLTGEDIKTSASDETTISSQLSNRLRLPIAIPANADLNNYITPGMYYCDVDATVESVQNCPTTHAFSLFVEIGAASEVVQTLKTWHDGNGYKTTVYVRSKYPEWGAGWQKLATATTPQEFDLPLAEGVSAVSSAYWKDQFGVVTGHFNVLASSSQTGSSPVIATLPEGFRPSRQANATAVVSSGESLGLLVLVTGEIQLQDAASVTLEGKYIKGLFSFVAAT